MPVQVEKDDMWSGAQDLFGRIGRLPRDVLRPVVRIRDHRLAGTFHLEEKQRGSLARH